MSGQDTTGQVLSDTLEVIKDTIAATVFDISTRSGGTVQADAGLEIIYRTQIISPAWLFIYMLVLLGFFAWIRMFYGNILTQTVQASTNFQVASRMFKDNSQLQSQLDNILYTFYFLSIALLLFVVEERFNIKPFGWQGGLLFLFNLALLVGYFMAKIVFVFLTGFLFNRITIFREYLYNTFIFNKLMGMVMLPMMLFVVYTNGILQDLFFWVAMTTMILVVMMRLLRGVVFSFKKDVSIFYMFLYLCALEITPLALLYRWLEGIL